MIGNHGIFFFLRPRGYRVLTPCHTHTWMREDCVSTRVCASAVTQHQPVGSMSLVSQQCLALNSLPSYLLNVSLCSFLLDFEPTCTSPFDDGYETNLFTVSEVKGKRMQHIPAAATHAHMHS